MEIVDAYGSFQAGDAVDHLFETVVAEATSASTPRIMLAEPPCSHVFNFGLPTTSRLPGAFVTGNVAGRRGVEEEVRQRKRDQQALRSEQCGPVFRFTAATVRCDAKAIPNVLFDECGKSAPILLMAAWKPKCATNVHCCGGLRGKRPSGVARSVSWTGFVEPKVTFVLPHCNDRYCVAQIRMMGALTMPRLYGAVFAVIEERSTRSLRRYSMLLRPAA